MRNQIAQISKYGVLYLFFFLDHCFIDGVCYASGDINGTNPCSVCIPEISTSTWSSAPGKMICFQVKSQAIIMLTLLSLDLFDFEFSSRIVSDLSYMFFFKSVRTENLWFMFPPLGHSAKLEKKQLKTSSKKYLYNYTQYSNVA